MTSIKHVMVATDGSEHALKAAAFAGDLARALGARVTVLLVQNEELIMPHAWGAGNYPTSPPYGAMPVEQIREMLEARVEEDELPKTVEAVGALDQPPEQVHIWGHPAEQVCTYASDNAVDLIVIGSHGRSGFKRVLLGSVSNAVANHAPCPVTIVR